MQRLRKANDGLIGELRGPSDKSITHRALILGALAKGQTIIKNPLMSADITSTMNALRPLGVDFNVDSYGTIYVDSPGMDNFKRPENLVLDMGNSGTSTRLLVGVFAGLNLPVTIVGDSSLSMRPMQRVINPLTALGAEIQSIDGHLPLKIVRGIQHQPINFVLPLGSAQVKNAVLLAGLVAGVTTTITDSFGTRDHTEQMLPDFGITVKREGDTFRIPGGQIIHITELEVPADISAAAFWLISGMIVPKSVIKLEKVNINKTRAGILKAIHQMEAKFKLEKLVAAEPMANIIIRYQKKLKAINIGSNEVPSMIDELPIIALAATQANGKTIISGAQELAVKETNRITTVTNELLKLGADITATKDGFIINGPTKLVVKRPTIVNGHGDHRIAMMLGIAALITDGEVNLADPDSVGISYPTFFEDLEHFMK